MRVFISSVREGLEEERDALRGIITAVGHTPVRFEDFSAQSEPSRKACLQGVSEADVYLLILGPRYGHVFPDTGNSPTHEEWTATTAAGLKRIVYRKKGVQFDPEQQELYRIISNYTTGVFHDTFADSPELLTKVAAKLRELEAADSELDFEDLQPGISFEWREDFEGRQPEGASGSQLSDSLTARIRATGFVNSGIALKEDLRESAATVTAPPTRPHSWSDTRPSEIIGIRIAKTGQLSAWATLPGDSMGSVLDPQKLPEQIAAMLRLVGALNIVKSQRVAIAIGVQPVGLLSVDTFDEHRGRNKSIGIKTSDQRLRVLPDESVSLAALSSGAAEVAAIQARLLVDKFNALR
jgi:hypothetical protein